LKACEILDKADEEGAVPKAERRDRRTRGGKWGACPPAAWPWVPALAAAHLWL